MRAWPVDERDSTWENDDAHYRVYVFHGPAFATSTFDVVDATYDEVAVFADAEARAAGDALWAIALVGTDDRGLRGLTWLSGYDYHDGGGSAAAWRQRAVMQDRWLRERTEQPPRLPDGLRVIRMFPDHGRDVPLWENVTDAYTRSAADLGRGAELAAALADWQAQWSERVLSDAWDAQRDAWVEQGWRLFRALQAEIAGFAEVRPEFDR